MESDRKKKLPDPLPQKEKSRTAAPKPGVTGGPDLALAGGYEEQRERLKPTGRAVESVGPTHVGGAVSGVSALQGGAGRPSAANFPRKARIISPEAAVMAKPQFIGERVVMLKRGEEVTLTGIEGSWYACIAPNGAKGYIHRLRVDKVDAGLRPGETVTETERDAPTTAPESGSPGA